MTIFCVLSPPQTLVFNSEKSAGVSEKIQGNVQVNNAIYQRCRKKNSAETCICANTCTALTVLSFIFIFFLIHISFRNSLQLLWRTCVFAQSSQAVKMTGDSALKWCPLQSESMCIRSFMQKLQTSI